MWLEPSDQADQDGPCPICGNEDCGWGFFAWADLDARGLPACRHCLRISNRGDNRNRGIRVEGQWSDEVIESRRKADLEIEEDA